MDFTSTLPLWVSSSSARMGFLAGLGTMGTRITLSLGDKGIGVRQTGPSKITQVQVRHTGIHKSHK